MSAGAKHAMGYFTRLLRDRGKTTSRSERVARDLRKVEQWGWDENIVGVSLSVDVSGAPKLHVMMKRKVAEEKLTKRQMIPKRLGFTSIDVEVEIEIEEVRRRPVLHAPVAQPGIQIAHERGTRGGTLGFLVRRGETRFLLSCSHVLTSAMGGARKGDSIETPFDAASLGPSIATLDEKFTKFSSGSANTEDFALARLTADFDPKLVTSGEPIADMVTWEGPQAPLGAKVVHHGAKNGPKTGTIRKREASIRVSGAPGTSSSVVLAGLVEYEVVSGEGDSGGPVVVSGTNAAAGLHTAGIPGTKRGFFYPVRRYLLDNGLQIVT